ncbi:unnamed protein product [Boreogadus saida]
MALNNLFVLVSMVIVCLAPGIHGNAHLSFAASSELQDTSTRVTITRAGCGVTRVCVDQLVNCDSSMEGSCLFASLEVTSTAPLGGSDLDITMQGTAVPNEYIAIALIEPRTMATNMVFFCGKPDGVFQFFNGNVDGDVFALSVTIATQIQDNIAGDLLQCQFTVPGVDATRARSADTTFLVQLARGAIGATGEPEGTFTASRTTEQLNLADPPSTVPTTVAPTTVAPTTAAPTTPGAHLSFANSSEQVTITLAGCGVTRVCVDQLVNCDSSMEGSCLFASLEVTSRTAPNGSVLDITMQGTAMANEYIAIALIEPRTMGTTMVFICGRMNERVFRFFTRDLNGSMFVPSQTITTQILGNIAGDLLQCQFTVPGVDATRARSADTTFAIQLARGALGANGPEGTFIASRTTDPLNLADPSSTVPTTVAPTTAAPTTAAPTTLAMTTSSGPASFIPSASLLLWSVLALPALLRM